MKLRLSSEAKRDLANVQRYTFREFGSEQARRYMAGLRGHLQLLLENPRLGREAEPGSQIRISTHERHKVLYLASAGALDVVRVLHAAQQQVFEGALRAIEPS